MVNLINNFPLISNLSCLVLTGPEVCEKLAPEIIYFHDLAEAYITHTWKQLKKANRNPFFYSHRHTLICTHENRP